MLTAVLSGCQKKTDPVPQEQQHASAASGAGGAAISFHDEASARGLVCVFPEQPRPMRTLESFGCGCAAFDADNDGWMDILLMADPHPVLFRNTGDGRFSDVTQQFGLDRLSPGNRIGCAVGDYDGDGWLYLLLTGFHQLSLCRNDRGQCFIDVTHATGLDPQNHEHWGAGAGFMDLDGDQWLDLVIVNYVVFGPEAKQYCQDASGIQTSCPPTAYEPEQGEIWRNVDGKRFEPVPAENGMKDTSGVGLVLAFNDVDEDGRVDFYVGNDARNADLMHNLGRLKFENTAFAAGVAVNRKLSPVAAMGADWGDFDRDGQLDLTVTDFQDRGSVLFRSLGNGLFSDVSEIVGIEQATAHHLGFGLNWFDFDNDGWLDIGYVNGHVYENISQWRPEVTYRQPVSLMHNQSGRRFADLVPSLTTDVIRPIVGRGSAALDFDNDGRMDFLVVDYEGSVMLLHNQTLSRNHWLKLDLHGNAPNHFAYGTRINAKAAGHVWVEQVSPSASYLSSKDPRIHIGLGSIDRLESLTIRWPSGKEQTLLDITADEVLRIDEPDHE